MGKSQILAKLKLSVLSFSLLPIGNICHSFFDLFIYLFYKRHIFLFLNRWWLIWPQSSFQDGTGKWIWWSTTRRCVSTRSTEWCDINRFLCFKFCFCHQNFRLRKREDFNDENHATTITPGHKPWNKRSEFWFRFLY